METDYGLDAGLGFPVRGKIILFGIASRPVLNPTQPAIHGLPGTISPVAKLIIHHHLVPR
jgi:hypothetical protein